ncbi:50S ribosomal protein L21e [Candidatus Woesearchaeota archaeon]|nr:50S ribosomal protein L21e [Candidatus Woesearchaeota archaeon]
MPKRLGSIRRRTRHKFSKNVRQKGKISLTRFFQEFKEGDSVCFKLEPAIQKAMYHPRFHGKSGKVIGKRGNCYLIKINDFNKQKVLIVHPVHLQRMK